MSHKNKTKQNKKQSNVASAFAVFSCFKEGFLISTLFYMLELKPEVSFVTIFETTHSHYKPTICKYHGNYQEKQMQVKSICLREPVGRVVVFVVGRVMGTQCGGGVVGDWM